MLIRYDPLSQIALFLANTPTALKNFSLLNDSYAHKISHAQTVLKRLHLADSDNSQLTPISCHSWKLEIVAEWP